jgi:hypothetical protein
MLDVDELMTHGERLRARLLPCFETTGLAASPAQLALTIEPSGVACRAELSRRALPLSTEELACITPKVRAFRFPRGATASEIVIPLARKER